MFFRALGSILLAVGCVVGAMVLFVLVVVVIAGPSPSSGDRHVLELVGLWAFLLVPVGWGLRRLGRPVEPDWEAPFD